MKVELTDFALRHWEKGFTGTRITDHTPEEFVNKLNEYLFNFDDIFPDDHYMGCSITDGYADFCKLITIVNPTDARTGTLPITLENYHYLRTGYHSRNREELPVLSRWFDLPLPAPKAKYLIIVVYSKEQLKKEFDAQNPPDQMRNCLDIPKFTLEADGGIVAILGQMGMDEEPMKPSTMIRNALGVKEGGSGIPIDREKYLKSVEFWKNNATVKS